MSRRLRMTVFIVIALVLIVVAGTLVFVRRRALILVHPPRMPVTVFPEAVGFTNYETIDLTTSDGIDLRGWYVPPTDSSGAVMIYLHGLGINRQGTLQQAATLYRHGYGALMLDLRAHGESGGSLSTLGYLETRDVEAAVNWLVARPEVNADQIGIMGESLGAVTAIRAAVDDPRLRAVIAQAAFVSIDENVADGVRRITGLPPFPFAPLVIFFGEQEARLNIGLVRPIDDIARISPRAVMLMHGQLDGLLSVDNSERLYEAAREPKELVIFPTAMHGALLTNDPVLWETRVTAFLDRYLRGG